MNNKNNHRFSPFMNRPLIRAVIISFFTLLIANPAFAQEKAKPCPATDMSCILSELETLTAKIEDANWRDQTWRELAKLYTAQNNTAAALAIIPRIENPDTQAMTIRGIGMAAAKLNLSPEALTALFTALRTKADKIEHPPSHGIALTYIAMSQAFAKDDAGAYATAKSMDNDSLRHKAFGESAEIQAERGDLKAALESLAAIDDASYRNKAHNTVAHIFADRKLYSEALEIASHIDNNYQKSQALLYIAAKQITPDEITLGIKDAP